MPEQSLRPTSRVAVALVLGALVAIGVILRAQGLGEASLSHPEVYIPGVDLAPEALKPPPRDGFLENLGWHFHQEPHPIGYYMGMFAWTSVFGDSETALRAPAVLFGAGSIFVIYALAAALYGRAAGFVAAAMLTAHGFHVFWSGVARMYVPGCFFALVATWLLVEIVSGRRRGALVGAAYVASIAAAVHTTELNWAIFAAHVIWTGYFAGTPGDASGKARPAKIVLYQIIAFALAAPALLHAVYLGSGGYVPPIEFKFVAEYFAFGFLFEPDEFSYPERHVGAVVLAGGFVAAAVLLLSGLGMKSHIARIATPPAARNWAPALAAALLSGAVMLGLAFLASNRRALLIAMSALPLAALAWPRIASFFRRAAAGLAPPLDRAIRRADPYALLMVVAGVATPVAIFLVSLWQPISVSRAMIVFTPYLLILLAAGLARLRPRRRVFAAAALVVSALFAAGFSHTAYRPHSPRDYKAIARAVTERLGRDDVVFFRRHQWMDTPVTYYLPHERLIGESFAQRLAGGGAGGVWVIRWADHITINADAAIEEAIGGRVPCTEVSARRATATLYVAGEIKDSGRRDCSL